MGGWGGRVANLGVGSKRMGGEMHPGGLDTIDICAVFYDPEN